MKTETLNPEAGTKALDNRLVLTLRQFFDALSLGVGYQDGPSIWEIFDKSLNDLANEATFKDLELGFKVTDKTVFVRHKDGEFVAIPDEMFEVHLPKHQE